MKRDALLIRAIIAGACPPQEAIRQGWDGGLSQRNCTILAYDATNVVLAAAEFRYRRRGELLKRTAHGFGSSDGLQQRISLDADAETLRKAFFTGIHSENA